MQLHKERPNTDFASILQFSVFTFSNIGKLQSTLRTTPHVSFTTLTFSVPAKEAEEVALTDGKTLSHLTGLYLFADGFLRDTVFTPRLKPL